MTTKRRQAELEDEERRIMKSERAVVKRERERESEERGDDDPDNSSGHGLDLEAIYLSPSVVVQGLSGLN